MESKQSILAENFHRNILPSGSENSQILFQVLDILLETAGIDDNIQMILMPSGIVKLWQLREREYEYQKRMEGKGKTREQLLKPYE